MSGLAVHQKFPSELDPPLEKPRRGMEWEAWLAKGRAIDRHSAAVRLQAVLWVSTAVLLVTALFWTIPAPYDLVVRFIVAGAALLVMSRALGAKQHALAAAFGLVALLYNPLVPTFAFSGDWQRALVVATAVLFGVSLIWRKTTTGAQ